MKIDIRKTVTIVEELRHDGRRPLARPLRLAAGIAVIGNPFAGIYQNDLTVLSTEFSKSLGLELTQRAEQALGTTPVVFGKGALVGEAGEVQHGSAIIHTPDFGNEQRRATGGHAVVSAAEKRGGVGSTLDMSLRNAYDNGDLAGTNTAYLFSFEIQVSDAPHADEILIAVALGDGPRPDSRTSAQP